MPCESMRPVGMTEEQREAAIDASLRKLEEALTVGTVEIRISEEGAVVLVGWETRDGVTDVCAVRRLEADGSWEWRQALASAEAMSGRTLNMNSVNSGIHSHDGGTTWSSH
jgi:hypothetical protein